MITQSLPEFFYTAENAQTLDKHVIENEGVPGWTLMQRAGDAAFQVKRALWPDAEDIVVLAGSGNNGGDGYVLATVAHQQGFKVQLFSMMPLESLTGECAQAAERCIEEGVVCTVFEGTLPEADLYVDALLGTGLSRAVAGDYEKAITLLNQSTKPVLALDVPSGLCADTGQPMGATVKATATATFMVVKRGLLTGFGPDHVGSLWFADLVIPPHLPQTLFDGVRQLSEQHCQKLLVRRASSHKGEFGDVLVVGGDYGMGGAAILAAEAAINSGAGRVTVATRPEHLTPLLTRCPECLAEGIEEVAELAPLLARASVVVLGPGLGQSEWSLALCQQVFQSLKARPELLAILDADALNLIAAKKAEWPAVAQNRIVLTPHPKEAARLMSALAGGGEMTATEVQGNRFRAVVDLARGYNAHVVLKGAGTLVASHVEGEAEVGLCVYGNPGMATAGMGDVLSGVIGALMAQGMSPASAAVAGVVFHAIAGDRVWQGGRVIQVRPLDLMSHLRRVLAPKLELTSEAKQSAESVLL